MADETKKTRISVNKDELDVASLELFNSAAKGWDIPRGKLLSRALYLAARELNSEIAMNRDINSVRKRAEASGKTVDEDVSLDTRSWLKTVGVPYTP